VLAAGGQERRNAEIEQFRIPIGVHKNVGGLQVAMEDGALVGEMHRRCDLRHQREDRIQPQRTLAHKLVQPQSFDQFHGDPRRAIAGDACVQQLGDAGVAEAREDFLLALKLPAAKRRDPGVAQDFDGSLAVQIAAPAAVYGAHAAFAEQSLQLVRSAVARRRRAGLSIEQLRCRTRQPAAGQLILLQQQAEFSGDARRIVVQPFQPGCPLLHRHLDRLVEQSPQAGMARRISHRRSRSGAAPPARLAPSASPETR